MKRTSKNKQYPTQITSKPLCDCIECTCRNCPDIMKLLSISLNENDCNSRAGGQKKRKLSKKNSKSELNRDSLDFQRNSITLPDFINENRGNNDCVCTSVARALRLDVQNNINRGSSEHNNGRYSKNFK